MTTLSFFTHWLDFGTATKSGERPKPRWNSRSNCSALLRRLMTLPELSSHTPLWRRFCNTSGTLYPVWSTSGRAKASFPPRGCVSDMVTGGALLGRNDAFALPDVLHTGDNVPEVLQNLRHSGVCELNSGSVISL